MASGITNQPIAQAAPDPVLAVAYTLTLSDYHALDMFIFDKILRKKLRFLIEFYGINTIAWAFLCGLGGVLVGSAMMVLTSPSSSRNGTVPLAVGGLVAVSLFTIYLIGFLPGSYHHKIVRRRNEKRFRRNRQRLLQFGIQKSSQNCRVVLTPEGFTEAVESREASPTVEVRESKVTKVLWVSVSSIDVRDEHAFFTVEDVPHFAAKQGFLILPQSAFDSEASFRAFLDTARNYREAAYRTRAPSVEFRSPPDTRIKGSNPPCSL